MIISNRKAFYNYHIEDKFVAGIVLTGTEVKSIRDHKANIGDSFVLIRGSEAFIHNLHISPFSHGNRQNHEPLRERKLLLSKKELIKLENNVKTKGYSIIPLDLHFVNGRVKVTIALAKGKKSYDKRDDIKEKDSIREIDRAMKRA